MLGMARLSPAEGTDCGECRRDFARTAPTTVYGDWLALWSESLRDAILDYCVIARFASARRIGRAPGRLDRGRDVLTQVSTERLVLSRSGRRLPGFRKAYITGLDRTPGRLSVEFRNGLMACFRETSESGRLFVPWSIAGYGTPIVGTATLAECSSPYMLSLELARGKLNDVRNQTADWVQMGLRVSPELSEVMAQARKAFIQAALSSDSPESSSRAGDLLTEAYVSQILENRLASAGKLTAHLGCMLTSEPDQVPSAAQWPSAFNAAQVGVSWKQVAPSEGKYRWDLLDAQLAFCRRNRLEIEAGPLIEFRPSALPDWIWLWERDQETISGLATDFVRQVVARYRGKVPLWHVVARPGSQEILGLSEEEQIRITARVVQAARQADPTVQLSISIDRPWAEWMSSSHFQLGPLHLCDYLLRSDLGISSIGIEIAPGFTSPGSHLRDLFEFSRLLDLYSLLNVQPGELEEIAEMATGAGEPRRDLDADAGDSQVGAQQVIAQVQRPELEVA